MPKTMAEVREYVEEIRRGAFDACPPIREGKVKFFIGLKSNGVTRCQISTTILEDGSGGRGGEEPPA